MERLREANLKLQPDKCQFLRREVTYLGHVISNKGVKPDPKKLEAVREFPTPKTPKNIKQFLGLAGYYRRFIPEFSKLARSLTQLLKNETPFEWGINQQRSFEILKKELCKEPVLQYPDFSKPFILTTDASGYAIGGILSQGVVNKDQPIAYASRTLNDSEVKYDTYEKEALAIVYCVKHFRPYLYGRKFTLVTDHKPLMWFKNAQDANMRILRWRLKLAEYDYNVIYKAGKTNVNADALSRNPVEVQDCKITNKISKLNPHDPKDAEYIRKLLEEDSSPEESDEEDEIEKYASHYPDHDIDLDNIPNPDIIPFTAEELAEPALEQVVEAQVHAPLDPQPIHRMVTRSKAKADTHDLLEDVIKLRRNIPAKPLPKEDSDDEQTDAERNIVIRKPRVTHNLTVKTNIIESRDLHYLRKDNLLYFTDTLGNPVDIGARKLYERQEIPKLNNLHLGQATLVKRYRTYHIILPISEDQTEGPTEVLTNITQAIANLRKIAEDLRLASISIAKSETILNIPWDDIKSRLQIGFLNSDIKIIICYGLIKCPPKDIQATILQEMHCTPVGGHRGVTKTYNRIRQHYHWENLKTDVQRYIQQCLQCQLKKLVRVKTKQPMVITDTLGWAFDKIAMDIVGPLPRTEAGNEYILTMQDQLSKFCIAVPLKDQTAATIADKFVKRFITIFGSPKAVLTDQGRNFVSDLMKKLAKYYRIRKFRTTAFHPQSNGSLERSHHALIEYLKQYANDNKQWDEWVDLATQNYNTSIHEGTKHTPYELVFGRPARTPSSEPLADCDKIKTYDDYLIQLFTQLHQIQTKANENLTNSKLKSKTHYDKRINPQSFKPGDYVFLLKGPKPGKFGDQYTGPHEVLAILNRNNVKIKLKKNSRIVHPNRLRLSHIKPT